MKIYSIYDKEFSEYGRIINHDFKDILEVLKKTPCPQGKTVYKPSDKALEKCPSFEVFQNDIYGNMPVQLGYCNGENETLNCLEYHMDSEVNLGGEDFFLMLGKRNEIVDNKFDTSKVKCFLVPKAVAVEVFATSLHYAPCGVNGNHFHVLVCLPKGTNTKDARSEVEPLLWATNKWLLAHQDSPEAKLGAHIGLVGENLKLC